MSGLGRIYCYFGRHVRSRGRARRIGDGWHSYCRQCGIEMFKDDGGDWYVVPEIEDDAPVAGDDGLVVANGIDAREAVVVLHDSDHGESAPAGWRFW